MPCENYREALIEAAASDSAPSRELRSHLDACASCRAALAEEKKLFAAIDTGLCATANLDVPASFLPRVRAKRDERSVARRSWVPGIAVAAAAAVLATAIVFVRGVGRDATESNTRISSVAGNVLPAETKSTPHAVAPSKTTVASVRSKPFRPAKTIPLLKSEEVVVLIPPGQKLAIDALLGSVQQDEVNAEALLSENPEEPLQELQVPPLSISPIEMKPLGNVSTQSESRNEKAQR